MREPFKFVIRDRQCGVTMLELMVALGIGSFLMIGAIQVYNQSRQAYVINESIARVQETAQFALDTMEADLRMASHWGRTSRSVSIEGRSTLIDGPNPLGLPVPVTCGPAWALDLGRPIQGQNNAYALPCPSVKPAQGSSDVVTTRRATVAVTDPQAGRLQIQTNRLQGAVFADGVVPAGYLPADSETHDLLVNSYYVAQSSTLVPGVPTLRRKSLTVHKGAPTIVDQEVAPGIENLQIQFGVDVNSDNTVDRYVNPGDNILNAANTEFIPGARIITARIWLLVRSISPELGLEDTREYKPGDVDLGAPRDEYRRLLVSKTILLRNARS